MEKRDYDLALHFSRKAKVDLEAGQGKARAFVMLQQSSKSLASKLKVVVSFASN